MFKFIKELFQKENKMLNLGNPKDPPLISKNQLKNFCPLCSSVNAKWDYITIEHGKHEGKFGKRCKKCGFVILINK